MNQNFTQQPSAQLVNKIDDSVTVLVATQDGKFYGNKDWSQIESKFGIRQSQDA